jgi:alpha-L-rhamnosidase
MCVYLRKTETVFRREQYRSVHQPLTTPYTSTRSKAETWVDHLGRALADYAMLFAVTLLDYVKATGDKQTGQDLFPIAAKQFEFFTGNYTEDLRYEVPASGDVSESSSTWHFVDCKFPPFARIYHRLGPKLIDPYAAHVNTGEQSLDKECAEHAIMIYCLKAISELTTLLEIPQEPAYTFARSSSPERKRSISNLIPELVDAHNRHYYDPTKGVYISGPRGQVSWASNAWAVIAGIPRDQAIAQRALKGAYELPDSVRGLTPYLHHYVSLTTVDPNRLDVDR